MHICLNIIFSNQLDIGIRNTCTKRKTWKRNIFNLNIEKNTRGNEFIQKYRD